MMSATHSVRDDPVRCAVRAPLRWAIALMVNTPCEKVGVVGGDGRLIGQLTEHDVLRAVHSLGGGGSHGLRVAHAVQLALEAEEFETEESETEESGVRALPAAPASPAASSEPAPRDDHEPFPLTSRARRATTAPAPRSTPARGPEEPLVSAFWRMSGVAWLTSPAEAAGFCLHVLNELVPTEASFAYLYDIDDDVFRLVATSGQTALTPGSHAVARESGFARMALRNAPEPVALDGSHGEHAAATAEPVGSVPHRNALFMPMTKDGRLVGLIQLVNRGGGSPFSDADRSVIGYVSERVSGFISDAWTITQEAS